MKIVDFSTFIEIKEQVIYSIVESNSDCLNGLYIKSTSITNNKDWMYRPLFDNIVANTEDERWNLLNSVGDEINIKLEFKCFHRDGLFDESRRFAIYSDEDVQDLVDCLYFRNLDCYKVEDTYTGSLKENKIMKFFKYDHLPLHLQLVSKPFYDIANRLCKTMANNAEGVTALRKLLEAKDCAVRSIL